MHTGSIQLVVKLNTGSDDILIKEAEYNIRNEGATRETCTYSNQSFVDAALEHDMLRSDNAYEQIADQSGEAPALGVERFDTLHNQIE